jgi:hypothetical protein
MRIVLATFPSPSPSLSLSLSLPLPLPPSPSPISRVCVYADARPRPRRPADASRASLSHSSHLPLPLPLLSSPLPLPLLSTSRPADTVRTRTHSRPRLYNPCPHLIFLLFFSLPLVGVVGFAWQRPFRLAKGEGVTSILREIPLRFLQSKNSRVVFILLMLVYSVMQVFM